MSLFKFTRIAMIIVTAVVLSVVAMISMIQTSGSRNGGARRELMASLRTERNECRPDPSRRLTPVHPEDFIPRSSEDGDHISNATTLITKHGVALQWYFDGGYRKVVFYPLALSNTIRIEALPEPLPILVMVPLDSIDLKTIPNLYGCGPMAGPKAFKCQLSRMRALFAKHEIDDVATLFSDGSLEFLQVNDLFGRDK